VIENLPYSALRVFECAARHLSFKQAAEELFVTPAAVSLQIKTLEDQLGVKLFHRSNRGLMLTTEAKTGLAALTKGFASIADSVHLIRSEGSKKPLNIWTSPAFADKWLIPRLDGFSAAYPKIELNISASIKLIDSSTSRSTIPAENFHRDDVDLAIRFGNGDYPGCRVDKLLSVSAIPMCSPKLLTGTHPLRVPADLKYHTLLHDGTRYEGRPDWTTWLTAASVDNVDAHHGMHFSHLNLALTAAVDGQGVVLGMEALTSDLIESGQLVVPFGISVPVDNAYYAISLTEYADHPRIEAFRDWLIKEARESRKVKLPG
jgi:LysR family glycine cleavage system transcriptional activator